MAESHIVSDIPSWRHAIQRARETAAVYEVILAPGDYFVDPLPDDAPGQTREGGRHAHGVKIGSGRRIHLIGYGVRLSFKSSEVDERTGRPGPVDCIAIADDASEVEIIGFEFLGSDDKDHNTNVGSAVRLGERHSDVTIRDCIFRNCGPVQAIGRAPLGRCSFTTNRVLNASTATVLPANSHISGNWFMNDAVPPAEGDSSEVGLGSHAIYLFGAIDWCTITGNRFLNIVGHGIKLRGDSANYGTKGCFTISGNVFENVRGSCIEIGSDGQPVHLGAVVTGNSARNCSVFFQTFSARHCIVSSNFMSWDWRMPFLKGQGIRFTSPINRPGTPLVGKGCMATGNRILLDTPFAGVLHFPKPPEENDSITLQSALSGTTTYTFRTNPSEPHNVQRDSNVRKAVENLIHRIRSMPGNPFHEPKPNGILRDLGDVRHDVSSSQLVIASGRAFTWTVNSPTGAIVEAMPVADFRGKAAVGVYCEAFLDPVVEGNYLEDIVEPLSVSRCHRPAVRNNYVKRYPNDSGITPVLRANATAFGIFEGNVFVPSGTPAKPGTPFVLNILDAAPVIRRNSGVTRKPVRTEEHLQGGQGLIAASDGRAHTYLFYGDEWETGKGDEEPQDPNGSPKAPDLREPQTLPFRWKDGDTVTLSREDSGFSYVFTFRRIPDGPLDFNSQRGLIRLINEATEGRFTAAKLEENIDTGHIIIRFGEYAIEGNQCTCVVATQAITCGIVLSERFRGGGPQNAATETPIFTPLASKSYAPVLTPANAAAAAANAYIDDDDTIEGRLYLIRHAPPKQENGVESAKWWFSI